MIRVLLADDHTIMRAGLKRLFELDKKFRIVAEAENGTETLEQLRKISIDLLVLDFTMPGICGEDLIARIRCHQKKLPILILSMHNDPQVALRALRAGATGYLTKDQNPETLIEAARKVATGARYIGPRLIEHIALSSLEPKQNSGLDSLSAREFQVLRLLAQGLTVNQIAEQLFISNKTVSTHKARMMEKMALSSNIDILRFAIANLLT